MVNGDSWEDALVRPGYELSVTIPSIWTLVYIQPTVERKIRPSRRKIVVTAMLTITGVQPDDDADDETVV